jgi:hypothetical protein
LKKLKFTQIYASKRECPYYVPNRKDIYGCTVPGTSTMF